MGIYAIIGASAGLGRELVEALAVEGHDLVLVARDRRDLEALAADVSLRHGVSARVFPGDLSTSEGVDELAARFGAGLQVLDGLLISAAHSSASDTIDGDPGQIRAIVEANFLAVPVLVGALLPLLRRSRAAVVVGFGSIAAARGRSVNVAYSSAKSALQTYFQSLRHALAETGIRVQFYVIGYMDTGQIHGKRLLLPVASPARLAARVVRALGTEVGVVYHPFWWRLVCAALVMLPWALMRRLRVA